MMGEKERTVEETVASVRLRRAMQRGGGFYFEELMPNFFIR